jgi:hypothetical protein
VRLAFFHLNKAGNFETAAATAGRIAWRGRQLAKAKRLHGLAARPCRAICIGSGGGRRGWQAACGLGHLGKLCLRLFHPARLLSFGFL